MCPGKMKKILTPVREVWPAGSGVPPLDPRIGRNWALVGRVEESLGEGVSTEEGCKNTRYPPIVRPAVLWLTQAVGGISCPGNWRQGLANKYL
jgi:hypothetical protein